MQRIQQLQNPKVTSNQVGYMITDGHRCHCKVFNLNLLCILCNSFHTGAAFIPVPHNLRPCLAFVGLYSSSDLKHF